MRKVKDKAFDEDGSAIGHNGADDAQKIKYTQKFLAIKAEMRTLRGKEKELLNKAKDDGILKTAIRNAAKILELTEESFQAQSEIVQETNHIVQLFAESDGQYSFLAQEAA